MAEDCTPLLKMPDLVDGISLENNFAALRAFLLEGLNVRNTAADGMRINIDESDGEGFVEFLELSPDFNLIISQCRWNEKHFIKYRGEGWLRFNFCLDTTASFLFDDVAQFDLKGAECRIFHQPAGMDCGHFMSDGTPSVCVTVSAKRAYLTDRLHLNVDGLGDPLRAFLKAEHEDFFFERLSLSPQMGQVVSQMVHSPYARDLRRLHFEAKAHELICLAFHAAYFPETENVIPFRFTEQDRLRVEDARDILDRMLANPPSVPTLARRVGINRNKLTYGFKHLFGLSILDYHLKTRMEMALRLLELGDMSIADIADKVGYRHQASFTVAFKGYFGLSPKDVRKKAVPVPATL